MDWRAYLVDSWLKELNDWVLLGVELPLFSLGFLILPLPTPALVGVDWTVMSPALLHEGCMSTNLFYSVQFS